jgi:hypothetical protein
VSDATGDYNPEELRAAASRSHIVGDLVESYLRIAPGKLGVTFAVSVDLAGETAARFRAAGVPAECVTADTPTLVRADVLRRFARRDILQLVNVDLFGEGFDLPAIEVVSMGRPTQSYGLYVQQFGRALRPMPGKSHAIIIDHVGNVLRHAATRGLPDAPQVWTLDRRERRSKGGDGPPAVRACPACNAVYERFHRECPFCGHVPEPVSRSAPEHVDGDLMELDPDVLARLRGKAVLPLTPAIPYGAEPAVRGKLMRDHQIRVAAQTDLRTAMAWWAGWQVSLGRGDRESYRRFYLAFGVDAATAQTFGTREAEALAERVRAAIPAGIVMEDAA